MYRSLLVLLVSLLLSYPLQGQNNRKIPISFLPPPLETATYSLGIYNVKNGQLLRRLQEGATQDAFTAGLNGFITNWDGKDDAGKVVPPGKYSVRGYAVGALKVDGKEIVGNDWAADDENLRISHIASVALVPEDGGLVVIGERIMVNDPQQLQVARYGGSKTELLWHVQDSREVAASLSVTIKFLATVWNDLVFLPGEQRIAYRLSDGKAVQGPTDNEAKALVPDSRLDSSPGKDGTIWKIEHDVLSQYSPQGERLRTLANKKDDPTPFQVTASSTADSALLVRKRRPCTAGARIIVEGNLAGERQGDFDLGYFFRAINQPRLYPRWG